MTLLSQKQSNQRLTIIAILSVLCLQALLLAAMGQPLMCACGYIKLWEGNILSSGNSQHLIDWYTFTHLLHGFIFYFIISFFLPKAPFTMRLLLAVMVESTWEVIENTPMVIQHYREQALAIGYSGDSIINSLSDTVAMIMGFCFAFRFSWQITLCVGILLELWVAYEIHDNLTLNIINLIHIFPSIHDWQSSIASTG